MLKRTASDPGEVHEAIRGGHGRARRVEVLAPGELVGVRTAALLTLEPGASIGTHRHTDSEELYLVLEGVGTGLLDSDRFPVGPGDAWVCGSGHSHGLEAGADGPLRFLALLT